MKTIKPLLNFLTKMQSDPRIGTSHIAAYMALYQLWWNVDCPESIEVRGRTLMHQAKISSSATWHKVIKSLHEYGYIVYRPTFNKMGHTIVHMNV